MSTSSTRSSRSRTAIACPPAWACGDTRSRRASTRRTPRTASSRRAAAWRDWSSRAGPGVRIDTALREGDVITFDFDPLLAKVIAFASRSTGVPASTSRRTRGYDGRSACRRTSGSSSRSSATPTSWRHGRTPTGSSGRGAVGRRRCPEGVRAQDAARADPWHAFGTAPSPPLDVAVAGGWAQYRGWGYRLADDELDPVEPRRPRADPSRRRCLRACGRSMSPKATASPSGMRWWCWKR